MKDQGLYLSEFERDNCGAGFICNLNGEKSNQIIHDALEILIKLIPFVLPKVKETSHTINEPIDWDF